VTEPRRPHVIGVRLHSKGRPSEPMTMAKHVTRAVPKSAVSLSPTVWYMAKGSGTAPYAQVFTRHLDWAYFLPADRWNANGMIEPRIEVLA
jgi:hypothetical protein